MAEAVVVVQQCCSGAERPWQLLGSSVLPHVAAANTCTVEHGVDV